MMKLFEVVCLCFWFDCYCYAWVRGFCYYRFDWICLLTCFGY